MVKVTLEGVSKHFGEVKAADKINLKIKEGELFFLLGPSGCGKTTALRIIAGFYKPDEGKVYFDENIINDLPPYKRNVGMVFQNYALWPHMTVYDNIIFGLKIRGITPNLRVKKAKEALRLVKMDEYALRYPNQLSGGQQQRVALARALVIEPHLLLLDEPLSNLDAKLRLETREEIKKLQQKLKVTTIYVTHDQSEALSMADRIAIMNEGKIVQIGTPRDIYNTPVNKFVAVFIGETNFLEGKIKNVNEKKNLLIIKTKSGEEIYTNKISKRNFSLNEEVICSVRPEHIRLMKNVPKNINIPNIFKAKIDTLTYFGFVEHYVLTAFSGCEMKVTNFNPQHAEFKEGDNLFLTFNQEDVDVFSLN